MTRETKAGLVMASSFLCLVGVVLASKLRGENLSGDPIPAPAVALGDKSKPNKEDRSRINPSDTRAPLASPDQGKAPAKAAPAEQAGSLPGKSKKKETAAKPPAMVKRNKPAKPETLELKPVPKAVDEGGAPGPVMPVAGTVTVEENNTGDQNPGQGPGLVPTPPVVKAPGSGPAPYQVAGENQEFKKPIHEFIIAELDKEKKEELTKAVSENQENQETSDIRAPGKKSPSKKKKPEIQPLPRAVVPPEKNRDALKTEKDVGEPSSPVPSLVRDPRASRGKSGEKTDPAAKGKEKVPIKPGRAEVIVPPQKTPPVEHEENEQNQPKGQGTATITMEGGDDSTPSPGGNPKKIVPVPISTTQPENELPGGSIKVSGPPSGGDKENKGQSRLSPRNTGGIVSPPQESSEPSPNLLPGGGEPFVKTPPINFSGRLGGPTSGAHSIDTFDVHAVNITETVTWAGLSNSQYGSEMYASALQEFNRTYHQDAPRNTGDPQPEGRVYLPPKAYLEKKYTALISSRETVLVKSAQPGSPSFKEGSEARAGQKPNRTAGSVVPASAWSESHGSRTYKVKGQNQFLLLIARKTLGDEKRWQEIYHLNPKIRPDYPVPEGTEINLPADARVEPEGKP
jgi:hypothetical protein